MSHFIPNVHLQRLQTVLRNLPHGIVLESRLLEAECAVSPEPVPYEQRESLQYQPIREGEAWGQAWDCGWFHVRGEVPSDWPAEGLTLRLDFAGEALLYDAGGCPWMGLTNGSVFGRGHGKDTVHGLPGLRPGARLDFWVETGANALFGLNRVGDPAWVEDKSAIHGTHRGVLNSLRVCRFDLERWQLWLDLQVIESLVRALPEDAVRRMQLLRITSRALDRLPVEGVTACRELLKPIFELPTDPASVDVYGVGHAHIDTAWLWPLRETWRKCARTFASQIGLIERYPDYVFGASQAQLYAGVRDRWPALYAKIREAVAAGRWEVQGAMWVEADCNLIDGESMVRQVLLGKNFFRDEFGLDVRNLWLPDVFGYSGNLPQILRRAGVDYFLTQKLSWNAYNRFPHHTFRWIGIDGSEVLTHFPPEDTYNSNVDPAGLRRHETANAEAGLVQEGLCLFGVGNGGGGPKEEHIERALRCRNLNGCPRFHFSAAQPMLERLAAHRDELDAWHGELYFELHRGTLTTQAEIKTLNRRAEEALRAAEMLCASVPESVRPYPWEDFDALWKSVLIHQFHDILPGSSIHRVYAEAIPVLKQVIERCKALQSDAAASLSDPDDDALTLFNPSSTAFRGGVPLADGWSGASVDGQEVPVQREPDGTIALVEVPPRTAVTLRRATTGAAETTRTVADEWVLENDRARYVFDANLRLLEATDLVRNRQWVPDGAPGNRIELFEDRPDRWDAWDIDEHVFNMKLESARTVECSRLDGPVRSGLLATLLIGTSTIRQQILLEAGSARLDFVTDVEWREDHKLLRVAFPTTVRTHEARFEIQYGTVSRATHDNTTHEYAQFEAVGHRYADLSEPAFGVALLNDSKYGYRVKGSELSLSLLRAPTEPDPIADRGEHRFTYSILPHEGWPATQTVRANAAVLNQGVERFTGRAASERWALPVTLTGEGVELAVLKRAERDGSRILRLVETLGQRAHATLTSATDAPIWLVECDLLEWKDLGDPTAGPLELQLGPFEIRTVRLRPS